MSRFIESICILNGEIRNLEFHQNRVNQSRFKAFGLKEELKLENYIEIPQNAKSGKFKCRIIYAEKFEKINLIPYQIKPIQSVRVIEDPEIEYDMKFENRAVFESYKNSIPEDEIIFTKNGFITDTTYSNLVFFDGLNWITPKSFLLNGCMRQFLLNSGQIKEKNIQISDLKNFSSFKLINAMLNLEESPELKISIIV